MNNPPTLTTRIVFTIPLGYQFIEDAQKELISLIHVPLQELVTVVVTGYVSCLVNDEWPDDYYCNYYEDFVFAEYLPSLSFMDLEADQIEDELERASNELIELTTNLHYHYREKACFVYSIFNQGAYYYVTRVRQFGGHKKHLEVWLELEAFEEDVF